MGFGRSFSRIINSPSTRFLCKARHHSTIQSQIPMNTSSLFRYTSGRWLWNEKEQQEARYRRFDVLGLQQAACRAVGANHCISFEKIGEGNFNKAYRLVIEDGRRVIAKILHSIAGPPVLTTASEVATMEFAKTILNIPVPKVLAWSATDQNPVDAEYVIMEEAKGSQLHEVWEGLQLRTKLDVIREIVDVERKLLSVSFGKIGSLYFNDCGIVGSMPAKAVIDSKDISERIQSRFCIGPIVRREFWEKERSNMSQHHGPWKSSTEYLESVVNREIEWIQTYADSQKAIDHPWQYKSVQQHSPKAHIASLQKLLSAIPLIVPKDSDIISPRMWHPDFHAGNIYVDDQGRISSIIDWQGTWTTHVFIGANPPLLLDYGIDMLMKLPENFKDLDKTTKDKLRYQVSHSILIHSYETWTAERNALMYKMMRYPHGQTLKQLEAFAGGTWDNRLYPLQECLLRVEIEWEHFGFSEPCPYHFSSEEIREHREEARSFNESQEFWAGLSGMLTDEGYTNNDTFAKAVETVKNLRETGLGKLKGEDRDEFDKQTSWILSLDA